MGHTNLPMRHVLYSKMAELLKYCKGLREPKRSAAEQMVKVIYSYISPITYANPYQPEHLMWFSFWLEIVVEKRIELNPLFVKHFNEIVDYEFQRKKIGRVYLDRCMDRKQQDRDLAKDNGKQRCLFEFAFCSEDIHKMQGHESFKSRIVEERSALKVCEKKACYIEGDLGA